MLGHSLRSIFQTPRRAASDVAGTSLFGPKWLGPAWFAVGSFLWFSTNMMPVERHNLFQLSALVLLSALANRRPIEGLSTSGLLVMFAVTVSLGGLSVFALFLGGGLLDEIRNVVVVVLFVALGVTIGVNADGKSLLAGIGAGTLMVLISGIYAQWADPSRQIFSGSYVGVSGRESDQLLNAAIGLGVGLALMDSLSKKAIAAAVLAVLSIAVLVRLGMVAGFIICLALVGARLVQLTGGSRLLKFWPRLSLATLMFSFMTPLIVVQTRAVSSIAASFGVADSVSARLSIWDSAYASTSSVGIWIGHGSGFWKEGSLNQGLMSDHLESVNLPAYGNGHSMYLDLFLALGVIGLAIAVIPVTLLWAIGTSPALSKPDEISSVFPWLLIFPLALLGVSESVLVARPTGWLTIGLLAGMVIISLTGRPLRPQKQRIV